MHEVSEGDDLLFSYNFLNHSQTQYRTRYNLNYTFIVTISLEQVFPVREEKRTEEKRREEKKEKGKEEKRP